METSRPTLADFSALPKTLLHLHLDCSLSFNYIHKIDPSISLETYQNEFVAPAKCTNLADFLKVPPRSIALMQTPEQLHLATLDVFDQLKADNVQYAELRFAPFLHTEKGLSTEQVVEIINASTAEASRATGIEARLILCTLRHFSAEQSLHTARLVKHFQGTHVAALDIAGDEAGQPLAPHIPAFDFAREHHLPYTAHAGEASGPASVWETIKYLHPRRIGHGVRSSEDPSLVQYLHEQKIHLEVCPTSNIQTDIYDTYPDHTIAELYDAGLSLSINTDNYTISAITPSAEYEQLYNVFGWNQKQFLACNLNAIQAAFLPEARKQELAQHFEEAYRHISL